MLFRTLVLGLFLAGLTQAAWAADLKTARDAFTTGDYETAFSEYQELAKAKNAEGEYWLGHMYRLGVGTKKDVKKAVEWMNKAADQGLIEAKRELAEIYIKGDGVLQDFPKAFDLLQAAAHQNDAPAQRDLAMLYANGWGTDKSKVWALVWYDYAAKNKDKKAERARSELLKSMSSEEISEAESLVASIKGQVFDQEQ